ncbi:MAG: bifunctional 2',3'-cyclic-nucleotide 2'-phosphodiesterase/3'-nucleotidase [Roseinatronobacter sp.]
MPEQMEQDATALEARSRAFTTADLRILETTDLHVHLHPYDYFADCPNPDLGLSRLAELVDIARREVPNTLLFDNGDFLQGTPVGDFFAYDRGLKDGDLHPVTEAMNALRYDAITLGNHEFNYGLDFLSLTLAQAAFPVVSANILRAKATRARGDRHFVKPYSLLRRNLRASCGQVHPITIGVIGVAPPQITIWERQTLAGRIQTRDMVDTVEAWVPEMREAGADLVILLAHSGIGLPQRRADMENAVIPLARIEGVDVILSGHSHQLFPSRAFADIPGVDVTAGTICGKPTVMSGFFGSHLGVIDLRLGRDGRGWRVLSAAVENRSARVNDAGPSRMEPQSCPAPRSRRAPAEEAPAHPDSPAVRRIVERAHQAVLENIRQPIGRATHPINSFFVYLGQSAAARLVAQAQGAHVARVLQGRPEAALPLLSAVAPSKAGGLAGPRNYTDIRTGQLTLRALADLYIYPNRTAALRLTGADLHLWLERAASVYQQIQPGLADQPLIDSAHPGYNFEIIYGLDYAIDLTAPARFTATGVEIDRARSRVRDLVWRGVPVDPAAEFILCTNSYRAYGAGGFSGAQAANIVHEDALTTREILRRHVSAHGAITVDPRAPFRLQPVPGASAVLRTGVAAGAHLHLIASHAPEHLGLDPHGFLRLKIRL